MVDAPAAAAHVPAPCTAWLAAGEGATEPVEEATCYETTGQMPSKDFSGTARWRTQIENVSSGPRFYVIRLDLLIPERGLARVMVIRAHVWCGAGRLGALRRERCLLA
jgi:hypothetical protein